jgi:hypothetical protein
VQVNAIGTGNAHCAVVDWGSSDGVDLNVYINCRNAAGALADTRFNLFFALPIGQMAFALANQSTVASYTAPSAYAWNQTGAGATVERTAVGDYTVRWPGIDPEIVDGGTVLVSSVESGAQCKATGLFNEGVQVHCFGPNGAPKDGQFTALLGS